MPNKSLTCIYWDAVMWFSLCCFHFSSHHQNNHTPFRTFGSCRKRKGSRTSGPAGFPEHVSVSLRRASRWAFSFMWLRSVYAEILCNLHLAFCHLPFSINAFPPTAQPACGVDDSLSRSFPLLLFVCFVSRRGCLFCLLSLPCYGAPYCCPEVRSDVAARA